MTKRPPLVLAILDGFGEAPATDVNAITLAEPSFYTGLRQKYPFTTLDCAGENVGLPCGLMGNSEVGHLNIGAGKVVYQEISRIDRSIEDRSFFSNEALLGAVAAVKKSGGRLHLFGLVSDGGVHSSDNHLAALIHFAGEQGLVGDQLVLHAFLDGRDTPPRSAQGYLDAVEGQMKAAGVGRIGSVIGRFYAMDRDTRWERVQDAYDLLTLGKGQVADSAQAAVAAAYARDENDEFVAATVIGDVDRDRVRDGDAVFFFNYRTDRARQLTDAFTSVEFAGFERKVQPKVYYATMTRYREDFPCPVAFAPQYQRGIFPEVVSREGLSQLRIAETEKYAHVTFFFSGGDEKEFPGERRLLVPSPKVRTYDMQPSMSAPEVTDKLLAQLDSPDYPEVTILNFANADMVGHTGVIDAAIEAVKTLDSCLERVAKKVNSMGGALAITADHGNCEMMVDLNSGQPHTAHTTNPVPFLIVGDAFAGKVLRSGGRLCDIATTLLPILGLEADQSMEGVNLLS